MLGNKVSRLQDKRNFRTFTFFTLGDIVTVFDLHQDGFFMERTKEKKSGDQQDGQEWFHFSLPD